MNDIWTDINGRKRWAPQIKGSLQFKVPAHAALRAFVFHRDDYRCQSCGCRPSEIPEDFTGRYAITWVSGDDVLSLSVDHILPRKQGGSHHPDNLQTLCLSCNMSKSARVLDFREPVAAE